MVAIWGNCSVWAVCHFPLARLRVCRSLRDDQSRRYRHRRLNSRSYFHFGPSLCFLRARTFRYYSFASRKRGALRNNLTNEENILLSAEMGYFLFAKRFSCSSENTRAGATLSTLAFPLSSSWQTIALEIGCEKRVATHAHTIHTCAYWRDGWGISVNWTHRNSSRAIIVYRAYLRVWLKHTARQIACTLNSYNSSSFHR